MGLTDYRDALELDLLSSIGLVQAALPHMQRTSWGRVIVVTSRTPRHVPGVRTRDRAVLPVDGGTVSGLS